MSEFKTVVEDIKSDITKVVEVMNHRFDQVDKRFEQVDRRFEQVDRRFEQVNKRFDQQDKRMLGMMEQIALLHEGQTEIKAELRNKADNTALSNLEKRVARLENKIV